MIRHMVAAYQCKHYGANARMVLICLADHANENDETWPGVPLMARETNRTERATKRSLARFLRDGVITITKPGGGSGNHTQYRINLETLTAASGLRTETVTPLSPLPNDNGDTCDRETVTPVTINGDTCDIAYKEGSTIEAPSEAPLSSAADAAAGGFTLSSGTDPAPEAKAKPPRRGKASKGNALKGEIIERESDDRHHPIREHIKQRQLELTGVEAWTYGRDDKALSTVLLAHQSWDTSTMLRMVDARFASHELPGEPPHVWLPYISKWLTGATDRFGKLAQDAPLNASQRRQQNTLAAAGRVIRSELSQSQQRKQRIFTNTFGAVAEWAAVQEPPPPPTVAPVLVSCPECEQGWRKDADGRVRKCDHRAALKAAQ